MPPIDETTEVPAGRPPPGLRLRVMSPGAPLRLPLPARGAVVVGRSDDVDLRLDDRSISRRHAALHVGDVVEVEDLGSANGTRVRGTAVAPGARVALRPGDVVEFGTVLCALEGEAPPPAAAAEGSPGDIVVVDPAMKQLHALLDRVVGGAIHVLLLGETGVGKEVFAERLHRRSPRRERPFVKINCAALSDTLIESELFGYEKGAFTGAAAAKEGLLESAEGGTVFLDEVGELSLAFQAKLLRVLEDREVRRVGGLKARPVDVRVVAATNRDLEAESAAGRFRSDLYFRLNGFSLVIPALRERPREVAPLARHFARLAAEQSGRPAPAVSDAALALLQGYRWPGNIRELRNVMARAVLLSTGGLITPEHLPVDKMRGDRSGAPPDALPRASAPSPAQPHHGSGEPPFAPGSREPGLGAVTPSPAGLQGRSSGGSPEPPPAPLPDDLRDALSVVERQRIVDALDRCAGNQTRAAALLGISRRALVSKLEQYDLPRPRKGRG